MNEAIGNLIGGLEETILLLKNPHHCDRPIPTLNNLTFEATQSILEEIKKKKSEAGSEFEADKRTVFSFLQLLSSRANDIESILRQIHDNSKLLQDHHPVILLVP